MKVKNKIIVVTGGGDGMGREIALNLLKKGAKVAAIDKNNSALQETKKLSGDMKKNLSIHVLNVMDKDAIQLLPEQIIKEFGAVDGIVNNAGIIQPFMKVSDLDYDVIDNVMNTDFYGVLFMTKAFLPYLLERPEAHIVNVSSMGGFLPVPGQCLYSAAKAGVKLLTEGLSAELKNTNVNVSIIFPGAIDTNIKFNSGVEETKKSDDEYDKAVIKPLSPVVAAERIINAIEKNKMRVFMGVDSKLMNFLYRISPKFASNMIAKQLKSHIPD